MSDPVTPPVSKQRNWFARHKILTGLGVLLIVIIVGSAAGGGSKSKKPAASGRTSPSASPSAEPSPSTASTAPSAAPTTEAPPPPPVAPTVFTYKGRGNKVLTIQKPEADKGALISTTNVGAQDNFTIYALDAQLQPGDLLVNAVGSYRGTSILDKSGESTTRLKIDGGGAWTVTIRPLSAARRMTTSTTGKGDDVVLYDGPTGVATVTNRGPQDNFTIYYYGDSTDLLVNQIGSYTGETPIQAGPAFLEIDGAGAWSIKVTP